MTRGATCSLGFLVSVATSMLQLPPDYIRALEEVLGHSLDEKYLRSVAGKRFIQQMSRETSTITLGLRDEHASFVESKYLKNEAIRSAYLLYYSTIGLLKIWPPLRELAAGGFFQDKKNLRHLDLGGGTGTALWGLSTYLKQEQSHVQLNSTVTDALQENLRLVEKFAKHLHVPVSTSPLDLTALPDNRGISAFARMTKVDLVTMMNVLAEIDETHDNDIIEFLSSQLSADGAIISIEPSRKTESRRALRFRDRMVAAGFFVYAPCCRTGSCPALVDENNWCHTEIPWQRPDFIRAVDDEVGTLRLSLKATYVVYLTQDRNLIDGLQGQRDFVSVARVVSERFDEKGRQRFFACNENGRREYVMNKRDKSGANRVVKNVERYDLLSMKDIEVRTNDVKIGQSAAVDILSGAEGSANVDKYGRQ